jgi:hypothetical protein
MKRRQSMIRAKSLAGDCTFKVPSKYVVNVPFGASSKRLKSIFTLRSDHSEIVDQAPIAGAGATADGMSGDLGSVSEMFKSVSQRVKDDRPELYSTDNCCLESRFLLGYMPWLKGENPPKLTHLNAGSLFDGSVIRLASFDETQSYFVELMETKPERAGFDMEWFWLPSNGRQRKTALLQVAFCDLNDNPTVVLVHIAAFNPQPLKLPPALCAFLYCSEIQKLGVGISNDMRKLKRDFDVDFSRCISSCVDLGDIVNSKCPMAQSRRWSLSALAVFVLGKELPKPPVRLSNWEVAPLTAEQEAYAVDDAWAAIAIHLKLESNSEFTPLGQSPQIRVEPGDPGDPTPCHSIPMHPTTKNSDPKERLRIAVSIADEGLVLDSDWLQRPPVSDPDFIRRLNSEKSRQVVVTRVKLDPFHWMDRYARVLPKNHLLFPMFMSCLRDALFFLDPGDVAACRLEMTQRGMGASAAHRVPKHYFTKRNRCRRSIPQRLELAVRVQSVFEIFIGLADSDGVLLLKEKAHSKHKQCMEHVWCGCLSDIPGMPMYYERRSARGFPRYVTIRGTSQLECYHRWLRACISGSQLAPDLFAVLLLHFNYRWNVRCGIRSRGHHDQGTYCHWVLEEVRRRSQSRSTRVLLPGLIVAISRKDAEINGIDVDSIGFHLPQMPKVQTSLLPPRNAAIDTGNESDGSEDGEDDSSSSETDTISDDDGDGDGHSDAAFLPTQLSDLQKEITGDSAHASILAMSPVGCFAEVALIMRVTENHLGVDVGKISRKRQWGLDFSALASSFNKEALLMFQVDVDNFFRSGIRLKSPAHVKQFFERTDDALNISHVTSGVRARLIDVRQRLRTSTSLDVPLAVSTTREDFNHCSTECVMVDGGNARSSEDLDIHESCSAHPRPSSRRKAPRSCPECRRCKRDTTEHVYRQIGARSNMRFCCSHPECSRHSEEAITTAPVNKKRAYKNHRKSRTCVACHSLLKQRGQVGSHVLYCSNPGCSG